MLDQHTKVEEVEEDRRGPDEDVWQVGGVDLAQITRHEAILNPTVSRPSCLVSFPSVIQNA